MSSPSLVPAFSSDGSHVYVTSPEGNPALVPTDNLGDALGQKFQIGVPMDVYKQHVSSGDAIPGVHVTSPEGKDAILPSNKVHDAIANNGFMLGPSNQQNIQPDYDSETTPASQNIDQIRAANDARPWYKKALGLPADDQTQQLETSGQAERLQPELAEHLNTVTAPVRGVATAAKNLGYELPRSVYHSFDAPKTPDEKQAASGYSGRVGLAAKRLISDPQAAELAKARQARDNQEYSEMVGHSIAGGLPLIGPMAAQVGEAIGADPLEGIGEAAGYALAPEVLKKAKESIPAGLLPKAGASAISKVLGGGRDAMAEKPLPQQTAAGPASNAEVAQYAQDKGIDLLPGQATGKRGLKAVQAVGERAIVGDAGLENHIATQRANFGNLVDDFKSRVAPDVADTETAGQSLQQQAQAGLEKLKTSAQADYQGFQNATGDIPVDLSEVKAKFGQKLADQAEALKNVPLRYATPVKNVLTKLSSLEAGGEVDAQKLADFNNAVQNYGLSADQQAALQKELGISPGGAGVKMSTAQQLRSAYLDISRDYSGNVPKSVQRIAGEAAKDIDSAMAAAADKVGAKDQWRQANAKWKQLQDVYNSPESPLYKVLQEPDPSKVPGRLLGKGNYGGSPQTVRQLQAAGIDTAPLKREVAQQIADGNFKLTNGGRGLGGYSAKFLQTLFSPEEFNELTKMGRVGRAINFEMNPSGTSNVGEAGHQLRAIIRHAGPIALGGGAGFAVGGPVGGVIGAALAGGGDAMVPSLAARITKSQALRRAAIGDLPRTIEGNPSAFERIVRGGGQEPPPDSTPPASGTPQGTPPAPAPNTPPVAAAPEPTALQSIIRGGAERRAIARPSSTPAYLPAERIIKQAGLETAPAGGGVNKELGTITLNDPAYPNKPLLLNMADVEKLGTEGVKAKMAERLAQKEPQRAEAAAKAAAKAQPAEAPTQAATTEDPQFKKWFGNSKIVDDNGAPQVMYHGTTAVNDIMKNGFKKGWVYMTDSKPVADSYQQWKRGDSSGTLPLFVKAENPAYYDAGGAKYTDIANKVYRAASDAERAGHDAMIIKNIRDHFDSSVPTEPHTTVVAFKSEQIRHAPSPQSGGISAPEPKSLQDIVGGNSSDASKSLGAKPKGFTKKNAPKSGETGSARLDIPSALVEGFKAAREKANGGTKGDAVGMPDDLQNDIHLQMRAVAWDKAVRTPGSRVVIEHDEAGSNQGTVGTVIRGAEKPLGGKDRVLVEHEMDGQTVQRFYPAIDLEPASSKGTPESPLSKTRKDISKNEPSALQRIIQGRSA